MDIDIRPAQPAQTGLILAFIRRLADYEKRLESVVVTENALAEHLFGERPWAEAILAYLNGTPVGFALFFPIYSTFQGRMGLYIEDLFVEPAHRRLSIGARMIAYLAHEAVRRGGNRLEWSVLTWNESAIAFYRRLGALPKDEWRHYELQGAALAALAVEPSAR
ncbi:MAG TPA: GNAT family N-acetyltransferase [bacterium]|nr:GNAT family N-acetyltransferase [bacterium]